MITVEPIHLDVDVSEEEFEMELDTQIVVNYIGGDPFEGPYIITPKVSEQTLPTYAKTMTDDVTVLEIPYVEVANLSGGHTVTIGGI